MCILGVKKSFGKPVYILLKKRLNCLLSSSFCCGWGWSCWTFTVKIESGEKLLTVKIRSKSALCHWRNQEAGDQHDLPPTFMLINGGVMTEVNYTLIWMKEQFVLLPSFCGEIYYIEACVVVGGVKKDPFLKRTIINLTFVHFDRIPHDHCCNFVDNSVSVAHLLFAFWARFF